jgi:hypothetical protein
MMTGWQLMHMDPKSKNKMTGLSIQKKMAGPTLGMS